MRRRQIESENRLELKKLDARKYYTQLFKLITNFSWIPIRLFTFLWKLKNSASLLLIKDLVSCETKIKRLYKYKFKKFNRNSNKSYFINIFLNLGMIKWLIRLIRRGFLKDRILRTRLQELFLSRFEKRKFRKC